MTAPEEQFDVCDAHDRVIGQAPRSIVHRDKLLHRAVHIFVQNSRGELLFQRRSATKDECPRKLTSSASGHLGAGETYDQAAPRELDEELGLSGKLEFLHKVPASSETCYEHTALYRLVTDTAPIPNLDEMDSVEFVSLADAKARLAADPDDFSPPFRVLLDWFLQQHFSQRTDSPLMFQTVLVTGGCGFIGSNFIRLLMAGDPTVKIINVDKLTYAGNLENLADIAGDPRYAFERADVTDQPAIEAIFARGIDAVVNFAAESHVDRSILDSGPFIQTNIVGTQVLLDAARKHNVKRYVQVSTDEVYGSLGAEGFFIEDTPLAPNSPYSASKAAADMLVRAYCHTFHFPGVITRCSNNYGPSQFPEKIIPLFISNAIADIPLPVYGAGQNVRDWIHVSDHCRGIEAALRNGRDGEIYNFGGECELKNIDLTKAMLKALGKPETLIRYVTDRPGHDLRYAIDCTKSRRELGWAPQVKFPEGLADTIRWYQENSEWVARIRSGEYLKYYELQYGQRV
jgi:dTDP-glucose 4,6-dehydratase